MNDKVFAGSLKAKNMTTSTISMCIYGDIVAVGQDREKAEDRTPADMKEFLSYAGGRDLDLYINSIGGDVFAGIAIYNMLKAYTGKIRVYVEGIAGSIASVIAMAGDEIYIPKNSSFMIHRAWCACVGNVDAMEKAIEYLKRLDGTLADIYMTKTIDVIDRGTIIDMMKNETWLNGEEAAKIFKVIPTEEQQIYAMIGDIGRFKNIPTSIITMNAQNKESEKKKHLKELEKEILSLDLLFMIKEETND